MTHRIPRVGGGYLYGNEGQAHSIENPSRPRPTQPKGQVSMMVKEFDAAGVRAVEVIQGGATVWTAEDDGTIAIRNGFSGEVAHRITPKSAGQVTRMFATDYTMWVGMNDGSIFCYDHLTAMENFTSKHDKPHNASVLFFCPIMFNGNVLSGSSDGKIVKWTDVTDAEGESAEKQPFEQLQSVQVAKSLTALEAYGTFVFAGDLNGNVYMFDAATLQKKFTFEAHPNVSVTALKYMDGLLFSGGSDGMIYAWSHVTQHQTTSQTIGEGWHDAPIRKLVADSRAHQMWSVDASGVVHKWESNFPFAKRNAQNEEGESEPMQCGGFVDMAQLTTWDAVRVWSTGSNGANCSWFATWSRAEEQMNETIEAMNNYIAEKQSSLGEWQSLIDKIKAQDERRKLTLAQCLLTNSDRGMMRVYYKKWLLWLKRKYEVNRRRKVAECLGRTLSEGLARIYFGKLMVYYQGGKLTRQKMAMAENILCSTEKGLRRTYWKKISEYRYKKKKEYHRQSLGEALLLNTEKGLARKYFRKTMRYLDRMRIRSKREQIAAGLLRSSDIGLLRVYYFKWTKWIKKNARDKTKRKLAEAMMANTILGLQRVYYLKFWKWGQNLKSKQKKKELADLLRRTTEKGLLAVYQQKCDDWLEAHKKAKMEKELDEKRARYADLLRQQEAAKERMKRIEALNELRKKRDAVKQRKEDLEQRIRDAKKQQEDLKDQLAKKAQSEEDTRATREKLNDVMAKLKELVLNFDSDYKLITTTIDKCKSVPVSKLFLQSHMTVKGIIVNILKKSELPVYWPLLGKFKSFQAFQLNQIHVAIKTLVITFDTMTVADLDKLETDDEIVANADNLMRLYMNAQRAKSKQPLKEYTNEEDEL